VWLGRVQASVELVKWPIQHLSSRFKESSNFSVAKGMGFNVLLSVKGYFRLAKKTCKIVSRKKSLMLLSQWHYLTRFFVIFLSLPMPALPYRIKMEEKVSKQRYEEVYVYSQPLRFHRKGTYLLFPERGCSETIVKVIVVRCLSSSETSIPLGLFSSSTTTTHDSIQHFHASLCFAWKV